ncbi:MAG: hypothetical protein U1F48_20600 [Burkholderiales bacterium]
MKAVTPTPPAASPEQRAYAKALGAVTRVGAAILLLAFAAYVTGLLPAYVPLASLPALWHLPAAQYLAATGTTPGWGWLVRITHGEFASLAGIVILAGGSLVSLVAVLVQFRRRGDRLYALITLALMAVIGIAASGVLNRLHGP